MGWSKEQIVAKIYDAVDRLGRIDQQRLRQWSAVLARSSPSEVFSALYFIFLDESRPRTNWLDQEYAGILLFHVKPRCEHDAVAVIGGALRNYNVSVEELPWYFAEALGGEVVREAIAELGRRDLPEKERDSLETFLYWLKVKEQGPVYPKLEAR